MRGYNTSAAPRGIAGFHLDVLAADVLALAEGFGAFRFRLVGHDWGGVIAWWVAAMHPERVERMVVINAPHPDVLGRQALTYPTQALRSLYVALFQLPALPERLLGAFGCAALRASLRRTARADAFEPGALACYGDAWAQPGALTAMLNYYRALRLPRRRAPRIRTPTLLLWGERDSFLERHIARANIALCDDGHLTLVPEATHWVHMEEPERVSTEIRDWLGTIS